MLPREICIPSQVFLVAFDHIPASGPKPSRWADAAKSNSFRLPKRPSRSYAPIQPQRTEEEPTLQDQIEQSTSMQPTCLRSSALAMPNKHDRWDDLTYKMTRSDLRMDRSITVQYSSLAGNTA